MVTLTLDTESRGMALNETLAENESTTSLAREQRMRSTRICKVVLTTIALALTVSAGRPLLVPTPSYAARSEYKVVYQSGFYSQADVAFINRLETQLNELGKQEWEVAAAAGARFF